MFRRKEILAATLKALDGPVSRVDATYFAVPHDAVAAQCAELLTSLEEVWSRGGEGLIVKAHDSKYVCSKRSLWFKIKRLFIPIFGDTLDLLVVGYSRQTRHHTEYLLAVPTRAGLEALREAERSGANRVRPELMLVNRARFLVPSVRKDLAVLAKVSFNDPSYAYSLIQQQRDTGAPSQFVGRIALFRQPIVVEVNGREMHMGATDPLRSAVDADQLNASSFQQTVHLRDARVVRVRTDKRPTDVMTFDQLYKLVREVCFAKARETSAALVRRFAAPTDAHTPVADGPEIDDEGSCGWLTPSCSPTLDGMMCAPPALAAPALALARAAGQSIEAELDVELLNDMSSQDVLVESCAPQRDRHASERILNVTDAEMQCMPSRTAMLRGGPALRNSPSKRVRASFDADATFGERPAKRSCVA